MMAARCHTINWIMQQYLVDIQKQCIYIERSIDVLD